MAVDVAAVRAANPLQDTIEKMTGQQIIKHKVCCPFHEDRSPSLHVYDDGGWKCFGCGKHGDVIDFLGFFFFGQQYNPDSHFLDIVDRIGALDIKPLPRVESNPKPQPKKKHLRIPDEQVMHWHTSMSDERRAWWRSRGLTDTTIDLFRLGFDGQRYTIPVGYRGIWFNVRRRATPEALERKPDTPKYISATGSRVGLFNADILHGCQRLIICEGEIDAMTLYQHGIDAICSTGGAGTWRLNWNEHLMHIPHIYVVFDNDEAGGRGARKIKLALHRAKIVKIPKWYIDISEMFKLDYAPVEWFEEELR
jgi:DNA primase